MWKKFIEFMETVYGKGLALLGLASSLDVEQKELLKDEVIDFDLRYKKYYPQYAMIQKAKKKTANRKKNKAARKSRRINRVRMK